MPGKEPAMSSAKYIYVYRNPKDAAVSLYYHHNALNPTKIPWDGFLKTMMSGELSFGDVLDHHSGWWKHKGQLH